MPSARSAFNFAWFALPLVAWSKDAAVVALVVAAVMVLLIPEVRRAALANLSLTAPLLLAAMVLAWALAAAAWSPTHRIVDWIKAVPVILAAFVTARSMATAPPPAVRPLAQAMLAGVLALLALLAVERITGAGVIGLARPGDSRDRLFDLMSPGLALLSCMIFPAARLAEAFSGRRWAGAGLVAACLLLGVTYHMDAAPFAVACGCISYGLVRLRGKAGVTLVAVGIAGLAFAWGPLAGWAWSQGDQDWFTAHVNLNWGYRISIWNRVFELIGDSPWIGHGFDSARVLAQGRGITFLHPHNGFLQVWLELGLVGVILLLAWIGAGLKSYLAPPRDGRVLATLAATMTAVAVFWLISFGIWQGWWIAAIGLTASAVALAGRDLHGLTPAPTP